MKQKNIAGDPIRCQCGKIVAVKRDGQIFIMCKGCKRQIPITEIEPRAK